MTYQTETNDKNREQWLSAKGNLDICQENLAVLTQDHRELKLLKFENKPGRLLANLTKETYNPVHIPKMKTQHEKMVNDTTDVNKVFREYYQKLYEKLHDQKKEMTDILRKQDLPTLSESQLEALNSPITETNVQTTIIQLANNKSPGPDRYTAEF